MYTHSVAHTSAVYSHFSWATSHEFPFLTSCSLITLHTVLYMHPLVCVPSRQTWQVKATRLRHTVYQLRMCWRIRKERSAKIVLAQNTLAAALWHIIWQLSVAASNTQHTRYKYTNCAISFAMPFDHWEDREDTSEWHVLVGMTTWGTPYANYSICTGSKNWLKDLGLDWKISLHSRPKQYKQCYFPKSKAKSAKTCEKMDSSWSLICFFGLLFTRVTGNYCVRFQGYLFIVFTAICSPSLSPQLTLCSQRILHSPVTR